MDYWFDREIDADTELRKSDTYASRYYDMLRLDKTYPNTWKFIHDDTLYKHPGFGLGICPWEGCLIIKKM